MKAKSKGKETKNKFSFLEMFFRGTTIFLFMLTVVIGVVLSLRFYQEEKDVDVRMSNSTNLNLNDTVFFQFSKKMLKENMEKAITIESALKFTSVWQDANTLEVKLLEAPVPEKRYKITIDNLKTRFYVPQQRLEREISGAIIPRLKAVYPASGQKNIDISDRITVDFDRKIEAPFAVEVKVIPKTTNFEYKFDDSDAQIVIVPSAKMDKNTEYKIEVKLRHGQLDFLEEVYQGFFTTKPPPPVVYNYASNNEKQKTEEREEDVTAQITEGKYLDIDLSSQTIFLFEDGKEKGAFKVSTGKGGMDTPKGIFSVMGKAARPWSRDYGLFMPWFIQFTNQGHGIHELPEWPSGYKEGTNHLGIPVSHGCVRLGVGPAKEVYDFATIGMLIVVHK